MKSLILQFFILCVCYQAASATEATSQLSVRAIQPKIACEATGVDLMTLSQEDFDVLHHALLKCKVLIVRDQKRLTVEGQRAFSQRFGKLHVHLESASHHEGFPDVNLVSNIRNNQGAYIGLYGKHVENFHSDLSW